jgi:hypothetical protein
MIAANTLSMSVHPETCALSGALIWVLLITAVSSFALRRPIEESRRYGQYETGRQHPG